jgi:hypothetical protein
VCRSKRVEPSINFGIINSITRLHLVGISTESYYDVRIHEYQILHDLQNLQNELLKKKVLTRRQHLPGIDIGVIAAFGDM